MSDPNDKLTEDEFDVVLILISEMAHRRRQSAAGKRGKTRKFLLEGEEYYRTVEHKMRRLKLELELRGLWDALVTRKNHVK